MGKFYKTITAVVGAVINFATIVVLSDPGPIQAEEWLAGAVGLATAFGVYKVTNTETK